MKRAELGFRRTSAPHVMTFALRTMSPLRSALLLGTLPRCAWPRALRAHRSMLAADVQTHRERRLLA